MKSFQQAIHSYRSAVAALTLLGMLYLTACGTILYPERHGQRPKSGTRVDPTVVILDAIGILFFVIPGLCAFAVDFYTGAIYLPETATPGPNASNMKQTARVIYMNPEEMMVNGKPDYKRIEAEIEKAIGRDIALNQDNLRATKTTHLKSTQIKVQLAKLQSERSMAPTTLASKR